MLGAFVLPGFVTLLMRERTFAVRDPDTPFERLMQALYYSALVYVVTLTGAAAYGVSKADLAAFYAGEKPLGATIAIGVVVAMVVPVALTYVGLLWTTSGRFRPWVLRRIGVDTGHATRSAWNEAFGQKGTPLVRATLLDGRVVGGFYGGSDAGRSSLASYSQHDQDLYLATRWELDGDDWFVQPADGSLGLWLPKENLASVEFYEMPDEGVVVVPPKVGVGGRARAAPD